MSWIQASSSWRTSGKCIMLVVGTAVVLCLTATDLLERYELRSAEQDLRVKASLIGRCAVGYRSQRAAQIQADARTLTSETHARITFLDADGNVLADSAVDPALIANLAAQPEIRAATQGDTRAIVRHSDAMGEPMIFAARKVDGGDSPVAFVRVSTSVEGVRASCKSLERSFWTGAAGTALGMTLLCLFLFRPSAPTVGASGGFAAPHREAPRTAPPAQQPSAPAGEAGPRRAAPGFLTALAQEMRAPLGVIKACNETLLMGAVDDAAQRGCFLHQIDVEADHLHRLIEDGVTLADVQTGRRSVHCESVELAPVLAACLENHQAQAQARQVVLLADLGDEGAAPEDRPQTPHAAWADEEALGQLLDCLVEHAIHHAPLGGRIRLSIGGGTDQAILRADVAGPAICERNLDRVFEPFCRVDGPGAQRRAVSGLGFAIARQLAAAMGGSMHAEMDSDRGVALMVCLQRAEPAALAQ